VEAEEDTTFLDKDIFTYILSYRNLCLSRALIMLIVSGRHLQFNVKNVEKVQMRATKLIKQFKHLSYIDILKYFNLPTSIYCSL